jgi:ankyrin repeat protein
MQNLFRLGIEIDFSDGDGFTALHHAVLSGFEDCVKELINRGLYVNAMTQHGVPLNLAAQKERVHVISILVAARADKVRAVDFAVAHG